MAKLLIVESPGKLKTLRQILGRDWILEASVGHTTELAYDGEKRLGFEIEGEKVRTRYVPRGDRGKQVLTKLRQAAKNAERVYLATDPDREGEAIAWHLVEQLKLRDYCRVSYTEITESAVRRAVQNPGTLDLSLVASQRARQCLDKLVGFEVSPLLWNTTGGKSAGRVQTSTLHLVCERERERLAFKPEHYWVLRSQYGEDFEAQYEPKSTTGPQASAITPAGEEPPRVSTREEAQLIAEVARTSPHFVQSIDTKEEPRNPPSPLITSTLQQMAGARFRYSPKKTMELAQELYEGVSGKGLITYMRTDAVSLSPEFVAEARAWLQEHAPSALSERPPTYRAKADAQAAHEAIRPTSAALTPSQAAGLLNRDQLNVYTLIWERAMASQCKAARLSKTKITVACADTRWVARGMTIVDPGYLEFWKNTEEEKTLPRLSLGQTLLFRDVTIDERVTDPPSRFTEPKLVQLMEKRGIGRPSTYASTIATLKEREYVVLEKNFVVPTALGMASDETLGKALPDLVDTDFTAKMESALDEIAEGKLGWEKYLSGWSRGYFEPALASARSVLGVRARQRTSGPTTGKGRSAGSRPRASVAPEKIEKALAQAKKAGVLPICAQGHGELALKVSKKGGFYWRCEHSGCESWAWYQALSSQKCPDCGKALEKIPSRKVTGGYFLKCAGDQLVMFKDRKTKQWKTQTSAKP